MVEYIRSDLEAILFHIKIAEAHARGQRLYGPVPAGAVGAAALPALIPTYNLSWGVRTVDGSFNNLLPGREYWGASDQPFPSHMTPTYRTVMVDPDGAGPSGPVPMSYTPTLIDPDGPGRAVAGDVLDPALRTISNLIVDQTLANPAAIVESMRRDGIEGDLLAIALIIKDAYDAIHPLSKAAAAAQAAETAALAVLASETGQQAAAATAADNAASALTAANAEVAQDVIDLAAATAVSNAADAVLATAQTADADAEAALAVAQSDYASALDTAGTSAAALAAATSTLVAAGIARDAAAAAVIVATANATSAQTLEDTAAGNLLTAQGVQSAAQTGADAAQTDLDNATSAATAAQTALATATANSNDADTALALAQGNEVAAQAALSAALIAYNDAVVANQPTATALAAAAVVLAEATSANGAAVAAVATANTIAVAMQVIEDAAAADLAAAQGNQAIAQTAYDAAVAANQPTADALAAAAISLATATSALDTAVAAVATATTNAAAMQALETTAVGNLANAQAAQIGAQAASSAADLTLDAYDTALAQGVAVSAGDASAATNDLVTSLGAVGDVIDTTLVDAAIIAADTASSAAAAALTALQSPGVAPADLAAAVAADESALLLVTQLTELKTALLTDPDGLLDQAELDAANTALATSTSSVDRANTLSVGLNIGQPAALASAVQAQADLTAANGAVTTAQGTLATATANSNAADLALSSAQSDALAAQAAIGAAQTAHDDAVVANQPTAAALATAASDLAAATSVVTAAGDALATAVANSNAADGVLALAQADALTAQAALGAAQTAHNVAVVANQPSADALATATSDLAFATGGHNAAVAGVGSATAFAEAKQALEDAAAADVTTALGIQTVAQGVFDAAQSTLNSANDDLAAAQSALSTATANSTAADLALASAQGEAVLAQTALDGAQSTYNTAFAASGPADAALAAAAANLVSATDAHGLTHAALTAASVDAVNKQALEEAAAADLVASQAAQATAAGANTAAQTALTTANAELTAAQAAATVATAASDAADGALVVASGELEGLLTTYGIELSGDNVVLPAVATDEGLSAPFNSWFTLFGQFFDHGLDLVNKGGAGTVFIPLAHDDPLYDPGPDGIAGNADDARTNFMVLTRATTAPGADGVFGTADDVRPLNTTTSFVDQNQTYSSHPSHQVFLREYELTPTGPEATGRLIEGANGGMANWGELKQYASANLGIRLLDSDVGKVPLLRTDQYGNFIPGANGFPQVITGIGLDGIPNTADDIVIEGDPSANGGQGISVASAIRTTSMFLADIAHAAAPNGTADLDSAVGLDNLGASIRGSYDNELLDRHFIAGDGRVNENIGLVTVHHIFHAEHNRMVEHTKEVVLADAQKVLANSTNPDPLLAQAEAVAFLNEWLAVDVTTVPTSMAGLVWDGERLFQAAKFGTEMQYQHLVFEEFARKVQPTINIFLVPDGYDAEINPSIMAEFAHVVYRFGHSMLTETVDRYDANFTPNHISLIEAFLNPVEFNGADGTILDGIAGGAIVRGMTRQVGQQIDEFVTSALRDNLLGLPLDLATINLARGRDTGVPSLNAARREFFEVTNNIALTPYISWVDFAANLKNEATIINFIAAYGTHSLITSQTTIDGKRDAALTIITGTSVGGMDVPEDAVDFLNATGAYAGGSLGGLENVDLWIGGLAERTMPFGGMLGSTFNFVFEVQMESLQNGDRFYYLGRNTGQHLFEQLEANSLGSLIGRHTDAKHLPMDVFSTPAFTLEVDQTKQYNDIDGDGLLEHDDPQSASLTSRLVIRNNPATAGTDSNYLRYTGADHVVLGGTAGNETLIASIGDDTIHGDAGNDRIEGGFGNDSLLGGDGDDIMTDQGGDDVFKGGKGNDVMSGGSGIDLFLAGDGNDFVVMGNDPGSETFAGQGNDFVLSSPTSEMVFGNEGDDWIENGGTVGLIGDNLDDGFARDGIRGNDVFVGVGGFFDEYIGEGGDDIMVGSLGGAKQAGMSGWDWVTYKNLTGGIDASFLDDFIFDEAPIDPADIALQRFESVEGLSGTRFNDRLTGGDFTSAARDDHAFLGSFLDAQGIALIDGLQTLVGNGVTFFNAGDIILGGDGNDEIVGGGGDDIIDGDKWLNVRISVRSKSDPSVEIATADSMTELKSRMVDGTFNPSQLVIVREILTANGDGDIDTAVYANAFDEYDIVRAADGTLTVTHARGSQLDGSDTLRNIEDLRFLDRTIRFIPNATGAVVINDLTPTEGQSLTIDTSGIIDPNGVGPLSYQWQSSVNGAAWLDIPLANAATFTPDDNLLIAPGDQAGLLLRVIVSFIDGSGVPESITSAPTGPVGLDWDGIPDVDNVFSGNAGDDIADGVGPAGAVGGNDTLNGNDGNDILSGAGGNDTINGGNGNDRINYVVGGGADTVDGGADTDTLAITGSAAANTLNVTYGGGSITQVAGGSVTGIESVTLDLGGGADTLVYSTLPSSGVTVNLAAGIASGFSTIGNVENVTGSAGNDTLTGNAAANGLSGGAGDDVLTGGAGSDTLTGGAGNDVAVFNGVVQNFTFGGLNTASALDATGAEGAVDFFSEVETLRFAGVDYAVVNGTIGAETLTGTVASEAIFGFAGNDSINGAGGNDIIAAGGGNDTITQLATEGRYIVDGNNGTDTYVLNGVAAAEAFVTYTRANAILAGIAPETLSVGTDFVITRNGTVVAELDNIEAINVIGGAGNDTIIGATGNEVMTGGAGNDTLTGGAGNDVAVFNGGIQNFSFGSLDTINVLDTTGAEGADQISEVETLRFNGTNYAVVNGTINVDTLTGTAANEAIFGFAGNDLINAGDGNDIVVGGAGNDNLNGAAGNDVLIGGAGNDTLVGGAGNDVAIFNGVLQNFTFGGLNTASALDTTGAEGAVDFFSEVETLRFAGVNYAVINGTIGADTVTGNAASNAIFGFAGNDLINGAGGNDILAGGGGDDTITQVSNQGRDIVDGNNGVDTYVLNGTAGPETFNIYTRAAWLALAGNTASQLSAGTEIIIASGLTNATVIAELDNIEEITVNTLNTTAQNLDGVVNGGAAAGDTVNVVGNFNAPFTSLAFNTITVNGSESNETVNISELTSAHRLVFNSGSGSDSVIGAVRPQDTINMLGNGAGSIVQDVIIPEFDGMRGAELRLMMRSALLDIGNIDFGSIASRTHSVFTLEHKNGGGAYRNPMSDRQMANDSDFVDYAHYAQNDHRALHFDAADYLII